MKKYGFTLIELIIVMVIIGILAMLAMPKYLEYQKDARLTRLIVQAKELEKASEKYYMSYQDWPRLSDDAYTAEQISSFGEKILASTGKVVELEPDGNYYDIDYVKINNYIKAPKDGFSYILQNPIGNVFVIEGVTEERRSQFGEMVGGEDAEVESNESKPIQSEVPEGYIAIYTREDLEKIGKLVQYPAKGKYILMKNIDLSEKEWTPIPNFLGVFDGNGLEINNLMINMPQSDNKGLFARVSGATIKNLVLDNVDINGRSYIGGIAGEVASGSTLHRLKVKGNIVGHNSIGGLVGISKGYTLNKFTEVIYIGKIIATSNDGGGLCGDGSWATLRDSYMVGFVSGPSSTRPLLGRIAYGNTLAVNCYTIVDYKWLGFSRDGSLKSTSCYTNSSAYSEIEIKSEVQMKQQATYKNWNFNTIWEIDEGNDYPRLRWEQR